jgi:hypothetical protein
VTRAPCDLTKERGSKAFMRWDPGSDTAKPSPKIRTVLSQNEDSRRARCA